MVHHHLAPRVEARAPRTHLLQQLRPVVHLLLVRLVHAHQRHHLDDDVAYELFFAPGLEADGEGAVELLADLLHGLDAAKEAAELLLGNHLARTAHRLLHGLHEELRDDVEVLAVAPLRLEELLGHLVAVLGGRHARLGRGGLLDGARLRDEGAGALAVGKQLEETVARARAKGGAADGAGYPAGAGGEQVLVAGLVVCVVVVVRLVEGVLCWRVELLRLGFVALSHQH
mmetsp:Transcript_2935/g.10298  ORF Transcript_2935/g.10298 Transcript_2935/m.10298 type:complete len:229 (-) Transcript_2935:301-987(-)